MTLATTKPIRQKPISTVKVSAKRQAILRAAAKVFLARGYAGTSMELVAAESGAGRRTVYNQFESKKALFDATVDLLWDDMKMDQTISQIGVGCPPEQALAAIGNTIADFWEPEESVAFLRMVISESINFSELGQSYFAYGRDPARRAVIQYIKSLHNTKRLYIPDPDLAAAQFIGLIVEPLQLWVRVVGGGQNLPKKRRKHIVDEAVATFLCRYHKSQ